MAQIVIKTPEFRMSYPKVFKSELNKLNNTNEFSVIALFRKDDPLTEMKAAAHKACEDKWGMDPKKWPAKLKSPFRDQKEKAKEIEGKIIMPDGHEEGAKFLTLKTRDENGNKPEVYGMDGLRTHDTAVIYAGCWGTAVVNVKAYEKAGNFGVNFYLIGIQKTKEGEPLAGKINPESYFAPVAGATASGGGASSMFD